MKAIVSGVRERSLNKEGFVSELYKVFWRDKDKIVTKKGRMEKRKNRER